MQFRVMLAGAALALGFASGAQATAIETDLGTWTGAAGYVYDTTTSTGLGLYFSPVTSVALTNGPTVGFAGSADTVLQPYSGWGPWSGGYTGDIIDTTTNSETISFASGLSAFGFQVEPDVGPLGFTGMNDFGDSFTITLSDGTTDTVSGSYEPGSSQFIGFSGGNGLITSVTVTDQNAPDFAIAFDVPEPASMAVLGMGLAGLGLVRRRKTSG